MFIDTHAHLYAEEFQSDIQQVLKSAKEAGIQQIVLPNIDSSSISSMLELCTQNPSFLFPTMGLHPCYVKPETWEHELANVDQHLTSQQGFYALGEIGIDLYWDKSTLDIQKKAFHQQISWAKQKRLPIIIHARESMSEIFKVLDQEMEDNLQGVFHCFTGDLKDAQHILSYKTFKMGIGGVLTYKNTNLPNVLKEIDLEHLVLETDAPYLSPSPFRGKRNESSYLLYIAQKLAEIKQKDLKQVADITSQNAKRLFNIP